MTETHSENSSGRGPAVGTLGLVRAGLRKWGFGGWIGVFVAAVWLRFRGGIPIGRTFRLMALGEWGFGEGEVDGVDQVDAVDGVDLSAGVSEEPLGCVLDWTPFLSQIEIDWVAGCPFCGEVASDNRQMFMVSRLVGPRGMKSYVGFVECKCGRTGPAWLGEYEYEAILGAIEAWGNWAASLRRDRGDPE